MNVKPPERKNAPTHGAHALKITADHRAHVPSQHQNVTTLRAFYTLVQKPPSLSRAM